MYKISYCHNGGNGKIKPDTGGLVMGFTQDFYKVTYRRANYDFNIQTYVYAESPEQARNKLREKLSWTTIKILRT